MSESEIRGGLSTGNPAFRCAPCGLRLLRTTKRPRARRPAAATVLPARPSRQQLPRRRLRIAVTDAVDGAVVLVRNQQRSVFHLENVGRTAVELVLLFVEKAGQEWLDLRLGAGGPGDRHVIAELLLAIPRTVAGDKGDVLVGLREHVAGVELDAKACGMRSGQRRRQD